MPAYCYILYSSKLDKYFVGSTPDIERPISDHNRGKEKFTKTGLPWLLAYKETFETLAGAGRRELQIKKQKSRKYIELLISSAG
jgi:putative endonuclease